MSNLILLSTNGFAGTWPSIEYGAWVAQVIKARVVLLGVMESSQSAPAADPELDQLLERATALLSEAGVEHSVEHASGHFEDVVAEASNRIGALTVLGPLGRPFLTRVLVGRSIRSLLEVIQNPVLYVPKSCLPLKRMLICVGGLGYEVTAEHLALQLGAAARAHATLLHVAPPVDLDYPTARLQRDHWRDLEDTDSLLGRNLRAGLEAAQAAGMQASIKARQGDIVEEIVAEARSGDYDLICMGSPHGFAGLRQKYGPRVTDEVAEQAGCPVLTARFGHGSSGL